VAENPRIEELRRRVQADPAAIAFAALAEEFRRVGRYQDAIETCRAGLLRHPAYLSARVTLGRALIETGEYDAAREELETVLRSAPENIAAIRGLGQIQERLGHSTELHPDLAAMMDQPITPRGAPVPEPAPDPILKSAPPIDLSTFDLPLAAPEPPPLAFEPATIAFEAPVLPVRQPDPLLASTLTRLERFLGAIQTARHV
jgi:tetratricopeptide (TPR) repeat protein